MPDKRQSDALRLADELEDSLESHDGSSLTARCQGIADDAATELRRQHVELETLTLYKNLADEYGLSIFPDIAEMTAELETLREKLKTYEDLGGAADDMQLLRMGYAAARLEIESLKAQLTDQGRVLEKVMHELVQTHRPTNGAQTTAYAALPDAPLPVFSKGPWTFKETGQNFSGAELDEAAFVAYRDRASHGQAPALPVGPCVICGSDEPFTRTCGSRDPRALCRQPTPTAQAAPAYKDSTPELHIGDSAFESWYSTYSPAHKSDKQRASDAYAAGMGDPLVTAAPQQAVREPLRHEQAKALTPEQIDTCFDGIMPSGSGKSRYDIARSIEAEVRKQDEAMQIDYARLHAISIDYSDAEDECTGFRDGWRSAEKYHGITKGGQHGADT